MDDNRHIAITPDNKDDYDFIEWHDFAKFIYDNDDNLTILDGELSENNDMKRRRSELGDNDETIHYAPIKLRINESLLFKNVVKDGNYHNNVLRPFLMLWWQKWTDFLTLFNGTVRTWLMDFRDNIWSNFVAINTYTMDNYNKINIWGTENFTRIKNWVDTIKGFIWNNFTRVQTAINTTNATMIANNNLIIEKINELRAYTNNIQLFYDTAVFSRNADLPAPDPDWFLQWNGQVLRNKTINVTHTGDGRLVIDGGSEGLGARMTVRFSPTREGTPYYSGSQSGTNSGLHYVFDPNPPGNPARFHEGGMAVVTFTSGEVWTIAANISGPDSVNGSYQHYFGVRSWISDISQSNIAALTLSNPSNYTPTVEPPTATLVTYTPSTYTPTVKNPVFAFDGTFPDFIGNYLKQQLNKNEREGMPPIQTITTTYSLVDRDGWIQNEVFVAGNYFGKNIIDILSDSDNNNYLTSPKKDIVPWNTNSVTTMSQFIYYLDWLINTGKITLSQALTILHRFEIFITINAQQGKNGIINGIDNAVYPQPNTPLFVNYPAWFTNEFM